MKVIPIYASCTISGFESPAAEYLELPLSLDQLLIAHPNASFIGRAQGESMLGVGIFPDDLLLVDRAIEAKQGDVVVCNYNGEFCCKIIDKDTRRLLSANDAYPAVSIDDADCFSLEGVVTSSIRMHHAKALI